MFIPAQCLNNELKQNIKWPRSQSVKNYLNFCLIMLICSFITFSTKRYFSAFKCFYTYVYNAILLIVTFDAKTVAVKLRIIQFFSFIDNVKSFSPLFRTKEDLESVHWAMWMFLHFYIFMFVMLNCRFCAKNASLSLGKI